MDMEDMEWPVDKSRGRKRRMEKNGAVDNKNLTTAKCEMAGLAEAPGEPWEDFNHSRWGGGACLSQYLP